jgi:methyl-accepting chemotaxis protein
MFMQSESREMKTAGEDIQDTNDLISRSLIFVMSEGVTDVSPLIKSISQLDRIEDLRVIPSDEIKENAEQAMDDHETEVLATGTSRTWEEEFKGEYVVRSIASIVADAGCIQCHDSAKEGDGLATISVRYSISETHAAISSQKRTTVVMALGSLFILLVALIFVINKAVITRLKKLIESVKILSVGDTGESIDIRSDDEIGSAAESLRTLQSSLREKTQAATEIAEVTWFPK